MLEAVEAVYRALSNGEDPPGDLVDRISATLLGPLADSLDSWNVGSKFFEEGRTLWIAPDRRLHDLPFEVLLVPDDRSERSSVRLIERARVAYLPSAWALPDAANPASIPDADTGFVAFGGVGLNRDSAYPSWVSRLELEPLPAAREELETVAKRLGGAGRIYFASEATEDSFRAAAARSIGVIHFATHTALVNRRGGGTAILLTPNETDDGMLSPAEVAGAVVAANLVVLAACTTAPGGGESGSALSNLTGAFLAAGSRAVLATLWPVADQPTAVFMDQFYFRLAKGLTPAEALRQTKLRFMSEERWRSPAFWSGYVLIGSSPPVVKRRFAWVWIGALVLAVAVGLTIWRTRAPKRNV
jgi:CHAT domain-containing protein